MKLFITVIAFSLISIPTLTLAESSEARATLKLKATSTNERTDQQAQERKDAARTQVEVQGRANATTEAREGTNASAEVRANVQARLGAEAKTRVKVALTNIVTRLNRTADRLEHIDARIKSRIAKIEGAGTDLSASTRLLIDARAKIGTAKESIAEVEAKIDVMTESDTPREVFAEIRTLIRTAEANLREAHRGLQAVIPTLKTEASASINADAR